MRKLATIISFLFVFCQYNMAQIKTKTLRQYYYWTNQAELAICDSNFLRASDCYDKAFSYHRPFGTDLIRAVTINSEYYYNEGRIVSCYYYLAQMGDPAEWYVEDTLANIDLWLKLKNIEQNTSSLVIPDLKEAFEEIRESDQRVRIQQYDSQEARSKAINDTDSCNLQKIKDIYVKYPDINEYTAGCNPLHLPFLIHVSREFLFDPKTLFFKEIRKGNVNAAQYASMEDLCKSENIDAQLGKENATLYGTNPSLVFIIDTVGFIIQPKNVCKVNKNRRKIYLSETWENFAYKMECVYKDTSVLTLVRKNSFHYPPEEALEIINTIKQEIDQGKRKGQYYRVN